MKYQVLDSISKYAILLVLSPKHGSVCYNWKSRSNAQTHWETISIPSHTCLLYVKDPGQYMCTVDGEDAVTHLFTVALSGMCACNSFVFGECTVCLLYYMQETRVIRKTVSQIMITMPTEIHVPCHFSKTVAFVDMNDVIFESVIGRGSFAVVHKGRWRGREVALKSIRIPSGAGMPTHSLPQEAEILRYLFVY